MVNGTLEVARLRLEQSTGVLPFFSVFVVYVCALSPGFEVVVRSRQTSSDRPALPEIQKLVSRSLIKLGWQSRTSFVRGCLWTTYQKKQYGTTRINHQTQQREPSNLVTTPAQQRENLSNHALHHLRDRMRYYGHRGSLGGPEHGFRGSSSSRCDIPSILLRGSSQSSRSKSVKQQQQQPQRKRYPFPWKLANLRRGSRKPPQRLHRYCQPGGERKKAPKDLQSHPRRRQRRRSGWKERRGRFES